MLNKSSPLKLLGQRNKNCSWRPCFLAEWNQMKKHYRRSYIDASCQVWFNLAKKFQRRFVKKSSPLKLLGQMDPNLAISIYIRSSIKFLRFVPFGLQIRCQEQFLFLIGYDLFNISQSETRIALGSHICWPNGMKRRNFTEDLT
jgi:hypothetical protein